MNSPQTNDNDIAAENGSAGSGLSFDEVLMYIESGETIPVVGPDLLTMPCSMAEATLYEAMAAELARQLNVDLSKLSDPKSLNTVIVKSDRFRGKRQVIYPNVLGVLNHFIKEKNLPLPEPLKKLAEITHFKFFLTTTFDDLLATAVNQARFNGSPKTSILKYCPNDFDDLPPNWADDPRETVYHLFGQASRCPDYAVTDEDVLEFMHAMQSREGRPQNLFDKLSGSHLLFLGVGFPDWLARFFLRVAKNRRLWETRDRIEIVADHRLNQNQNLVYFFNQFSRETFISRNGAVEFINKLHDRWKEKHMEPPSPVQPVHSSNNGWKKGSIFISYASENRPQAKAISDKLSKAGLEVWYDKEQLEGGDAFEAKIQNHIRECDLFLPIISAKAGDRDDGFFRQEWGWAVDRARYFFGTTRRFLFPIVVDGTEPDPERFPDKFNCIQWIAAPNGILPDDSVEQVRDALMSARKPKRVNA